MYLLFQDVLENDDIQLDSMFIASIVFDILRVCCVAIIRRDIQEYLLSNTCMYEYMYGTVMLYRP